MKPPYSCQFEILTAWFVFVNLRSWQHDLFLSIWDLDSMIDLVANRACQIINEIVNFTVNSCTQLSSHVLRNLLLCSLFDHPSVFLATEWKQNIRIWRLLLLLFSWLRPTEKLQNHLFLIFHFASKQTPLLRCCRWNLIPSLRKGTRSLVQKLYNPLRFPTTTQL